MNKNCKAILVVAMILSMVSFFSCSSGGDGSDDGLAGTKWVSSSDSSNYIEFYSGGTAYVSAVTGNDSNNVTYSYSGGSGEFKLSYSGASTTIGTFKISGDKLTFYMVGGSMGADYYKTNSSSSGDSSTTIEDTSKYPEGTPWWNNKGNYYSFEKMDLVKCLLDAGSATLVHKGRYAPSDYDLVVYYDWYEDDYYGSSVKIGYYYKVNDGVDSFTIPLLSVGSDDELYSEVSDSAFANQSWLKYITIPKTIENIYENSFSGDNLETINFKGTVETWCKIGGNVSKYLEYRKGVINFENQYSTSYIDFDGVDSICDYAFYNCTNINSVCIGSSVTSIGEKAFYGCINLDQANFYDLTGWRYYTYGSYYSSSDVFVGYSEQQCAANLIGRNGCEENWSGGMYKSY